MINYLMVIPTIVLLIAVTLEVFFYLEAVIGLEYATFAAARAATVWNHHGGPSVAQTKAKQAAAQAMTPFANGMPEAQSSSWGPAPNEDEWVAFYSGGALTPVSKSYIRRKFRFAFNQMEVAIEKQSPKNTEKPWDYEYLVKVDYQYRFHIPLAARALGHPNLKWTISRSLAIACEAPKNTKESLGVPYD